LLAEGRFHPEQLRNLFVELANQMFERGDAHFGLVKKRPHEPTFYQLVRHVTAHRGHGRPEGVSGAYWQVIVMALATGGIPLR